jgi:NTE family protein
MGCCESIYDDHNDEQIDDVKYIIEYKFPFENLAIEGSSSNVCLVVGAYKVLFQSKILENIKQFAGTSSGSFIAACGAVCMDYDTLEDEIMKVNGDNFKDDDFGIIRDVIRFFNNFGFYRGDMLEEWIEDVLCRHTGVSNITFDDIYKTYDNKLYIPVVNMTKMRVDIYSHENTPNMVVSRAIKQSCTLPFIFEPEYNSDNDTMVDGGVCYNYPIDIFDNISKNKVNMKTLGLKIMNTDEEKRKPHLRHIDSVKDLGLSLIDIQLSQIEYLHSRLVDKYWERSIILSSVERNIDDFKISEKEKIRDINSGIHNTSRSLLKYINNGVFN